MLGFAAPEPALQESGWLCDRVLREVARGAARRSRRVHERGEGISRPPRPTQRLPGREGRHRPAGRNIVSWPRVSGAQHIMGTGATLVACALAFACLHTTEATAANSTACGSLRVTHKPSGLRFRIGSLTSLHASCTTARRVVRNFYTQLIGSSGATLALGYGCAYHASPGTSRVVCTKRSARLSWIERAP